MAFDVSRRWFIGGLASWGAFGGSRVFGALPGAFSGGTPKLKFGVISDVHIRVNPKGPGLASGYDTATLEHTLTWYRDQGVDAVAVVGDIADRGIVEEMEAFAATWFKVFPNDRAPDGRRVERIVVYGNHDWGGQHYRPFVLGKYKDESRLADHILIARPKEHWERIFHEPWEHVYRKDIKGYTFVGAQWSNGWCKGRDEAGIQGLDDFFATQKGKIDPSLPFFFFQHPHPKNTCYGSWAWGHDNGSATKNLSAYSNAVAFSGHSHYSLTDERSIWQGEFTAFATPSLSYASLPAGHENSRDRKIGPNPPAMPAIPDRRDLRGGQGYVVSVYGERMVVERIDVEEDCVEGAPAWIVPLVGGERPFDLATRRAASVAPQFPDGATLRVDTRITDNRVGKWMVAMNCVFPAAIPPKNTRVFDYEIRAVPKDGSQPLVKKFLSPAYSRLAKYEPKTMRFWFDAAEVPQDVDYTLEVRACNCFGKASRPLVSKVWHSVPGLSKVKR